MYFIIRTIVLVIMLLFHAPFILAQTASPLEQWTGHWEGAVQIPGMELKIDIDLAKNSKGELAGTFGSATQNVKGLPFSTVTVDGRSIRLMLKAGKEVSTFVGLLSADGKSITGDASQAGQSAPFSVTRNGEARIAAVPKSPAIGKELEGTWNGTLEAGENKLRVILTMANQPDGTASGTIFSPDGSGAEIPIAMTQKGANLKVEVPSVGASYVADLNAAGTELVGTWTQGPTVLQLTFRRVTSK